jgi:hypothetical protein
VRVKANKVRNKISQQFCWLFFVKRLESLSTQKLSKSINVVTEISIENRAALEPIHFWKGSSNMTPIDWGGHKMPSKIETNVMMRLLQKKGIRTFASYGIEMANFGIKR